MPLLEKGARSMGCCDCCDCEKWYWLLLLLEENSRLPPGLALNAMGWARGWWPDRLLAAAHPLPATCAPPACCQHPSAKGGNELIWPPLRCQWPRAEVSLHPAQFDTGLGLRLSTHASASTLGTPCLAPKGSSGCSQGPKSRLAGCRPWIPPTAHRLHHRKYSDK